MECIFVTISLIITSVLFWIAYELYYKIKSHRQNKKYVDIIYKSNINKSTSDNEIPGSWEFVTLEAYLKFYKIIKPTKEEVCKIIGKISDEKFSTLKENEIADIYHRLYFAIKTKPKSVQEHFWELQIPEEYRSSIDFEQSEYSNKKYFYLCDLEKDYCGDEQKLELYKQELLKGNLDYLSLLIASICRELGGVYRSEYIDKRAELFKKSLPVTKAMTVYKYFVGFEYADIGKINFENTEDQIRRISQEVKDAVWRRAKGKCENCGSQINLEFDHIIPFSKGGSNTYRNVQLLCEKCNREKSNKIG